MNGNPQLWIVGTDDFATEKRLCDGWTYFAMPDSAVCSFEAKGRQILDEHGLKTFHGKEYKCGSQQAFTRFLRLLREAMKDGAYACNTLIDQPLKSELSNFAKRVVSGSIKRALPTDTTMAEKVAPYAPVLFTAARTLQPLLGPNRQVRLLIDDDTSLPDIGEIIWLPPTNSCQKLLQIVTDAYRQERFPSSPSFAEYPVEKMRDNRSVLIQAADVLGNFSLAYVFTKLGHSSKTRTEKAQLLENVFADTMKSFDFSAHIALQGSDFCLKKGGYLTLQMGKWAD